MNDKRINFIGNPFNRVDFWLMCNPCADGAYPGRTVQGERPVRNQELPIFYRSANEVIRRNVLTQVHKTGTKKRTKNWTQRLNEEIFSLHTTPGVKEVWNFIS